MTTKQRNELTVILSAEKDSNHPTEWHAMHINSREYHGICVPLLEDVRFFYFIAFAFRPTLSLPIAVMHPAAYPLAAATARPSKACHCQEKWKPFSVREITEVVRELSAPESISDEEKKSPG